MNGHAPSLAPLAQTLALLLEQVVHLLYYVPFENVIGGGAVGFLVTYLFIALQKVLKKIWTFCFFATFSFTILLVFINPDIVHVDWNVLSRRTQATFSQAGRTAGNTFSRLPSRDLDAWMLLGVVIGGVIAHRIHYPPKHEYKWGGGGTVSKKQD